MNESIEKRETKECPYCAEEILKTSEVCEFCGSYLIKTETENNQPVSQSDDVFLLENQYLKKDIVKKWFGFKWVFAAVFFSAISFGYKFYKEAEDKNDCELAKRSDTKESWEKYIEKHADGKCAIPAVSKIDQKITENIKDKEACDSAQTRNTKESWEFYIWKFPDGKCSQEGHERISFIEAEERKTAEEQGKELANWTGKAPDKMNWKDAGKYCKNLKEKGYSDWRLPKISELRKLIKNCPATETGGACKVTDKCLSASCCSVYCIGCFSSSDGRYSKLGDTYWFWSSSALSDDKDNAWYVNFHDGYVGGNKRDAGGNVRCVRSR